ncbi:MAG: hypothetical protein LC664_06500, partial [Flavobacteriales bacterium]|nr:hypothetical protein [Flavobacteriales bacterium]
FTGNNTVEMADFSFFSCKYGLHFTDEEYDPIADINCNGVIDIADFSIFSVVYGLTGDGPDAAQ